MLTDPSYAYNTPYKKIIPKKSQTQYPVNQLKIDVPSKGFVGQEKLIRNPSGKSKSSCGPRKVQWSPLGAENAGVGLLLF